MDYSQLLNLQKELDQKEKASKTASLNDRDEKNQKVKITTPPLLPSQPQKTNERTNERFIVSTLHRKNDCSFHLPNVSPNALSIV